VRIIGVGLPAGGDDGVGPAVIEALRADPPPGVRLHALADPAGLVALLDGPAVVIDAVVGAGEEGEVVRLDRARLAALTRPLSSHGLSVPQALELAEALTGQPLTVQLLGVCVRPPAGYAPSMRPAVRAAIPRAAAAVRAICEELDDA